MQRDEADAAPRKPRRPCQVCGTATELPAIGDLYPLCLRHYAEWVADARFGSELEANVAATPGWVAEKRKEAA